MLLQLFDHWTLISPFILTMCAMSGFIFNSDKNHVKWLLRSGQSLHSIVITIALLNLQAQNRRKKILTLLAKCRHAAVYIWRIVTVLVTIVPWETRATFLWYYLAKVALIEFLPVTRIGVYVKSWWTASCTWKSEASKIMETTTWKKNILGQNLSSVSFSHNKIIMIWSIRSV